MKREEENSTFHESKEYFKKIKARLQCNEDVERKEGSKGENLNNTKGVNIRGIISEKNNSNFLNGNNKGINNTMKDVNYNTKGINSGEILHTPIKTTPIKTKTIPSISSFKTHGELICYLLNSILKSITSLTGEVVEIPPSSLCTMHDVQKKLEILLKTINEGLKKSNDAVYNVLHRMDSACREIVLSNSDLLEIIQKILLKFSEVSDILDFDQSEETINTLFDMSRLIYIYQNKLKEVDERIILEREYKMKRFGFYYTREVIEDCEMINEEMLESLCMSGPDIPYTDWTTWIGTFTETRKESFEGTPLKKMCVRKKAVNGVECRPLSGEGITKNESTTKDVSVVFKDESTVFKDESLVFNDESLSQDKPLIFKDKPLFYDSSKLKSSKQLVEPKVIPFEDLPKDVKKIGEATFSEVFKSGEDVYKIIPLEEGEGMTPYDSFLREAHIQRLLSKEKGVCRLKGVLVAKGLFSPEYLKAWDEYGIEENERPSKYGVDQVYGVLVMEDAGIPLEKYSFGVQKNLVSFIKSLVRLLSRLETRYEFEHRDLHWGNILISKSKINLIDFTLSRLKVKNQIFYNDLSNYPWLFQGDASVDEQFGIYRKMRDTCGGDWASFNPLSNFFWMEYIINKCYSKMKRIRDLSLRDRLLKIVRESKNIKELEMNLKRGGL